MAEWKNLCYNCFQEKPEGEGPCPYCGFDLEENEKKFPVALRAGTVLNDRYIIGRVLGQGGFGITYLALDTQLNAKVAIKEFMPGEIATRQGTTVSVMMDTKSEEFAYGAERFQEEARTLAKFIGNPNIAAVTSYFDENDTSYFVMDYIEGISFKTYIANHGGKISVEETLNVMIPVLRALTAVHAEGFIHRDVTPDNIYITKDGMVKLLDFGSARYSIGDKSKSLDVILKVGYAPKEQYIRRSRQGPFTDVYSCAACFYAAITGFLPPESLERLDHDELVPISQCGIDIPEYLDKAILKGLAVQPEDRFQSAAEFLDAIESQQVVEVPVSGGAIPAPGKKAVKPALMAGIAGLAILAVGLFWLGRGARELTARGSGNLDLPALQEPVSQEEPDLPEATEIVIQGEHFSTSEQELFLQVEGWTDHDLQGLRPLVNLKTLDLSISDSQITDWSPLAELTQLEHLNLVQTSDRSSILEMDLSFLKDLTNLRSLEITVRATRSGEYITMLSDLSPLAGLTNLQALRLDGLTDVADLSPLAGLAGLETLSLRGAKYDPCGVSYNVIGSASDLSPLAGLTNLKSLSLLGLQTAQSLEPLSRLTSLQELYLCSRLEQTDALAPLEALTNLQTLELYASQYGIGSATDPLTDMPAVSLEPLASLQDLTRLYLTCKIPGGDLSPLGSLTNLETLTIDSNNYDVPVTDLSPLESLDHLSELTVIGAVERDTDQSPVAHVPHLTFNSGIYYPYAS